MKVVVNVPEAEVERLGGLAQTEVGLLQRLAALPEHTAQDRIIVLGGVQRAALEAILGCPLDGPADVLREVKRLASVRVGNIERPLSAGEAERINAYAASRGTTPESAMADFINPILDQWLEAV